MPEHMPLTPEELEAIAEFPPPSPWWLLAVALFIAAMFAVDHWWIAAL